MESAQQTARTADGQTIAQRFAGTRGRPEPSAPGGSGEADLTALDAEPLGASVGDWLGETFIAGALYVLGAAIGLLGVLAGLYQLARSADRSIDLATGLTVAAWIVGGLALAAALAAMAMVLVSLSRWRQQVREWILAVDLLTRRIEQLAAAAPDAEAWPKLAARLDQLAESVEEVAHNSLLDESARAQKRRQLAVREQEQAVEQIRREMVQGQWDRAAHAVDRFRSNFPSETELAGRLTEELERRRRQAESNDIAECRRQCEDLMAVGSWERAVAIVGELVQKHPDSTEAKALLVRVEREQKLARDEQRRQLYAKIQRHTSRRQWRDALESARQLVERFADSIEAEAIKTQMDTLSSNAEIQYRQQVEKEITDLLRRQRFEEAVHVAENLIGEYPNSPQAAALRGQLPRLKERADAEAREARKRRIRWD